MICDLCEQEYDGEHTTAQCEANLLDWIAELDAAVERLRGGWDTRLPAGDARAAQEQPDA